MLELQFLGIGGAFRPEMLNTSACFSMGNTLYLLDCGGTVLGRLIACKLLETHQKLVVIITHTHADHVGGLGTLLSYCRHFARPIAVTVVHPEETLCTLLELNGIPRSRYTFSGGDTYADANVKLRFFPVSHTQTLRAFGLTLTTNLGETIYYSGDANAVPQEIWTRFVSGAITRIYQDCAIHSDPKAHGSYERFLSICPSQHRASFFPIHWDEDLCERILQDGFGLVKMIP